MIKISSKLIKIILFKWIHLNMSSAKRLPFCPGFCFKTVSETISSFAVIWNENVTLSDQSTVFAIQKCYRQFMNNHWKSWESITETGLSKGDIVIHAWTREQNGRPFADSSFRCISCHYGDIIMSSMASQITSLTTVCRIISSFADQRKHQSSASLAFVRGIHRGR